MFDGVKSVVWGTLRLTRAWVRLAVADAALISAKTISTSSRLVAGAMDGTRLGVSKLLSSAGVRIKDQGPDS